MDEARAAIVRELAGVLRRYRDLGIDWLPFAAPALRPPTPAPARPRPAVSAGGRRSARSAAGTGRRLLPPGVEGAANLAELAREIGDCRCCPLAEGRRQRILFGEGDEGADVLFVNGWPGEEEEAAGVVWAGADRDLLARMLAAIHLDIGAVYSTFVVKCRPAGMPTPEQIHACLPCLHRQIATLRPRLMVAVGSDAARTLLATRQPIFQLRGKVHECCGVPLHVLYHPAFLRRHEEFKRQAWQDLQRIRFHLDRLRKRTGEKQGEAERSDR